MKKRILVVDDHPVVRGGLVKVINGDPHVRVADEAGTCREAMEKVAAGHYDLVVLDIAMPDGSGLDVLKKIGKMKPALPVLMLSIHPEEQYAVRALRAGARGYLTKKSAPTELRTAIKTIVQGKRYITPFLMDRLASLLGDEADKQPHELLSDREFEVMRMLAEGKNNKQIAALLQLSDKTISTHRARILDKMNVTSNAELARYAVESALL